MRISVLVVASLLLINSFSSVYAFAGQTPFSSYIGEYDILNCKVTADDIDKSGDSLCALKSLSLSFRDGIGESFLVMMPSNGKFGASTFLWRRFEIALGSRAIEGEKRSVFYPVNDVNQIQYTSVEDTDIAELFRNQDVDTDRSWVTRDEDHFKIVRQPNGHLLISYLKATKWSRYHKIPQTYNQYANSSLPETNTSSSYEIEVAPKPR